MCCGQEPQVHIVLQKHHSQQVSFPSQYSLSPGWKFYLVSWCFHHHPQTPPGTNLRPLQHWLFCHGYKCFLSLPGGCWEQQTAQGGKPDFLGLCCRLISDDKPDVFSFRWNHRVQLLTYEFDTQSISCTNRETRAFITISCRSCGWKQSGHSPDKERSASIPNCNRLGSVSVCGCVPDYHAGCTVVLEPTLQSVCPHIQLYKHTSTAHRDKTRTRWRFRRQASLSMMDYDINYVWKVIAVSYYFSYCRPMTRVLNSIHQIWWMIRLSSEIFFHYLSDTY